MRNASRHLLLALILLVAAALRLNGLSHDSLWGDEVCTVMLARLPIPDLIKSNITQENIPPLHHLILHVWIKLFGDGEFSVRMPSVLAGVAGVWMTSQLVRRLFGTRAGLIAALLLAVSPVHIAYSQECRSYALSVLLGIAATDLFVRLLRQPTQRLHLAYVLLAALGLYAHLYGLFTIAAHNLVYVVLLLKRRDKLPLRPRPWLVDNLAAAALFAPWVPIVLQWTRNVSKNFWVKQASLDDIARSYQMYAGSTAALIAITALIILGIAHARRKRTTSIALMLAILIIPVIVPAVMSVLTSPTYAPRYGMMATVAMCALAAAGITALPRLLATPVLTALTILLPLGNAARIPREDWRSVCNFIEKNMRPSDLAVVHSSGGRRLYNYYVHRDDVPMRAIDAGSIPVTLPLDGRRVWLIHHAPWHPLNAFVTRGNLRIERRIMRPGIVAVELTDEPPPSPASPTSSPSP
jgi:uncharacterized membrane protein